MLIRYVGGRPGVYKISYGREFFHFTPENDWTLDIKRKEIISHIFSLPNRNEFEVIEREPVIVKESVKEPVKESFFSKGKKSKGDTDG